ncbi:MAG: SMP-30/gluconolactonase/LRE family protein [Hyphomonas sp.]
MSCDLILEIPAGDKLGEGIIWDDAAGAFLWTDILGRRLHRYHLADAGHTTIGLHARLCSFGFTRQAGRLIAAFDREIGWLDAATGAFVPAVRPDLPPGVRFNDGRVGPDGAFWVGTMVEDAAAAGARDLGALYRFAPDGSLTRHLGGIGISNGLCWAPDGATLYHADSLSGRVTAYPFDPAAGRLGAGTPLLDPAPGGSPDGAVTDADGRYLSALWESSAVGVFAATGGLEQSIAVPATQVTCPAFGGEGMSLLAVTSARVDLTADQLAQEPGAGNVFIFRTPWRGLPELRFAGAPPR